MSEKDESSKRVKILNALSLRVKGKHLTGGPATTLRNIQLRTGLDEAEIKRIIADLESEGLVESIWTYFTITPKGRKKLKQAQSEDWAS